MNNIYLAGITRDNQEIYYSEWKFNKFSEEQKSLIAEVLPKHMYKDYPIVYTFGFDRLVGYTSLVEVEDYQKDRFFWVYRKSNSAWKVPVLINGESRMTTYMTLVFEKKEDKVFVVDCFFGKRCLPLPGNPNARKKGRSYVKKCHHFWQNHALAMPQDEIDIPKTLESLSEEDASRFRKCINAWCYRPGETLVFHLVNIN